MALNYQLRREKHAIGEFIATLKFSAAVSAPTFAKIVPLLNEAAKELDLPAPMNVQVFNVAFGTPQMPPPPSGTGFQRFAANGEIACSLWCDGDSISLTFRDYDRWKYILPKIVKTFSKIVPGYMAQVPAIHSFAVQYLNEFRGHKSSVQNAAELFKPKSQWISPFSYNSNEAWHCHVGQFIPAEGDFRYLINVNFDVSPAAFPPENVVKNHVKVLILAACHYDMPGKGPLILQPVGIDKMIEDNFNNAHALEKSLLAQIISDNYLAIMGEGAIEH